ncbi:MAG: alginate export family protein [Planctomycetes bacterium]|nr:alginate export family protein [Planctomycetota bacterium]MCB9884951.1 alginate export family protein [Planctomycetota bacterium]
MKRALSSAAAIAAAISVAQTAAAQNCYENKSQCFSFAPEPSEASRLDTGINLRSKTLSVTGDIRFRLRADDSAAGYPYADGDQMTSRARVQMAYQATENAKAVIEFNYSETWSGSNGYSDAQPGENWNGVSQAYIEVEDMFGAEDKWRVGRSNYTLANGLILGSCDYLQYPDTFTGAWVSRKFGDHDLELFVLDDDGPLQSPRPATRFIGATGKLNLSEDGPVGTIGAFYMQGTGDGDNTNGTFSNDRWYGAQGTGKLPLELLWSAEAAQRQVDGGKDVAAYRVRIERKFEGIVDSVSFTRTDSEGALHVNPADFNSAGLLHMYGGAWRSDLDTNQLQVSLRPGCDFDVDVTMLTLDRDGTATQLGDFETDIVVGKQLKSGVHASAAYGFDNDYRQVAFLQLTLFF